ncbi:MAG: hypothetical protein HY644_06395 [Acidobacteria bacterium]|nr:hypothetical protein [Acidobacteriota bacterium]
MWIFILLALRLLFPTAASRAASGENSAGRGTARIKLIINTDARADDLMAIAFLLTRREAVTVVDGHPRLSW